MSLELNYFSCLKKTEYFIGKIFLSYLYAPLPLCLISRTKTIICITIYFLSYLQKVLPPGHIVIKEIATHKFRVYTECRAKCFQLQNFVFFIYSLKTPICRHLYSTECGFQHWPPTVAAFWEKLSHRESITTAEKHTQPEQWLYVWKVF